MTNIPNLISLNEALETNLETAIFKALRSFYRWQEKLTGEEKLIASLYRGLILTSDHAASAGVKKFPMLGFDITIAEKPFAAIKQKLGAEFKYRQHQNQAKQAANGHAILIAPTGSGKTEAALLWAAQQRHHQDTHRIFYTLPYQASMNAMHERLCHRYFNQKTNDCKQVTILHSRALLKFYQDMMEVDSDPNRATVVAKWKKNLARLSYYPIQVLSPYQILKAAYSLKGYETLLLDYSGALFIFDEIHAYDPKRLALIITMMKWLAEHFDARFLVMTATMPPTVLKALGQALKPCEFIKASDKDFKESQRHIVHIKDGNLYDSINTSIAEHIQNNEAVLVCCNQVSIAQKVYEKLQQEFGLVGQQDIMLLHGRFNGKNRNEIESKILAEVRTGRNLDRNQPFIVVATQVVEVSLDVDFDTIYTEPAPLEALLQRFGRVNRGRQEQMLAPVHVFREPSNPYDKQNPYLPYDEKMVRKGLIILEDHCQERRIDESQVSDMLAEIYVDDIGTQWLDTYNQAAKEFQERILDTMKPFQSADIALQRSFYEMFDGTQVLPESLCNDYFDTVEEKGYLAASQYLVNISWGQYKEFEGYGLIKTDNEEFFDVIKVDYNSQFGLQIDDARQKQKGDM